MTTPLPKDAHPFEHKQLVDAGLDNPKELAYSRATAILDETPLTAPTYMHKVRRALGYTCPDCGRATVEPRNEERRATIAPHVTCSSCGWSGTRGDMERQQLQTFVDTLSSDDAYTVWKRVGNVTSLAEAGRGELNRELGDVTDEPVLLREQALRNTPEPLRPSPPSLAERFDVSAEAVEEAVESLRQTTPYDDGRLREFVRLSYATRNTRPTEDQLVQAQDGIGLIDGALQQPPLTGADEQTIEEGYQKIRTAIRAFVEETPFATTQEAIIAVRAGFEPRLHRRIRSDVIADAIGCNSSYAAEFELSTVAPFPVVLKKDHVASREVQPLTEAIRARIIERDERCRRCGANDELDVHHIEPVAQGGETVDENLAVLCRECHRAAHGGQFGPTVVYDNFASWLSTYDG